MLNAHVDAFADMTGHAVVEKDANVDVDGFL